jgi:hypothetical protein
MGDRHDGVGMNGLISGGQDLLGFAVRVEREAGAAGAAHAHRIPTALALQRVVVLDECDQHLIGRRSVRRAARGGDDAVGLGAVGHDSCILGE